MSSIASFEKLDVYYDWACIHYRLGMAIDQLDSLDVDAIRLQ